MENTTEKIGWREAHSKRQRKTCAFTFRHPSAASLFARCATPSLGAALSWRRPRTRAASVFAASVDLATCDSGSARFCVASPDIANCVLTVPSSCGVWCLNSARCPVHVCARDSSCCSIQSQWLSPLYLCTPSHPLCLRSWFLHCLGTPRTQLRLPHLSEHLHVAGVPQQMISSTQRAATIHSPFPTSHVVEPSS